jgi:hypothetical protein
MSPGRTPRLSQANAKHLAKRAQTRKRDSDKVSSYKRSDGRSTQNPVIGYKFRKSTGFQKLFHSIEDVKTAEIVLKKYKSKKGFASFSDLVEQVVGEVRSSKVHNARFINKQSILKIIRMLKFNKFLD